VEIATIGFTQSSAEHFFGRLQRAGIRRLIDVRLNNISQLAGFAKRDDLAYLLGQVCGADYVHEPLLAPTAELLRAYRRKDIAWEEYADRFQELIVSRSIHTALDGRLFDRSVALLCSEALPDRCHRRLVAEFLQTRWDNVTIIHL
jgi:uncharacterized protein (DUF488 family)